jgi:hypothetical protein
LKTYNEIYLYTQVLREIIKFFLKKCEKRSSLIREFLDRQHQGGEKKKRKIKRKKQKKRV